MSDSVTPWTVVCKAPLSLGFPLGKNTRVGCHALLQGIFPTQGWNPGLLHLRWVLYYLSYQRSPRYIWSVYLMLEIHPQGQKDVKEKGTAITLSLGMVRFLFIFPPLKYLYFNVTGQSGSYEGQEAGCAQEEWSPGVWPLHWLYSKASNTRAPSSWKAKFSGSPMKAPCASVKGSPGNISGQAWAEPLLSGSREQPREAVPRSWGHRGPSHRAQRLTPHK